MLVCKNCNSSINGDFCSNCGQSTLTKDVNFKYVLQEIPNSVFQVDRGFLFTVKELFMRPGNSIREYIEGKRIAHFKPISFVLLLSAIYVLLSIVMDQDTAMGKSISGFSQTIKDSNESGKATFLKIETLPSITSFLDWVKNNYAYVTLMLLPFVSLTTYISFLGKGYNYFEHLIINLYIEGQKLVVYLLFVPILYITTNETVEDYIEIAMFFIPILLATWTLVQFFNKDKKIIIILRLCLSYVLYFILFNVLMVLGVVIMLGINYFK